MAPLEKIEVSLIAPSRIAVRSESDYREAGSVDAVLRYLRTGGGFIHPAPIGSGKLDARDVNAFHDTPAVLRCLSGVPDFGAFWLVAHRRDFDVAFDVEALGVSPPQSTGVINAIAYSWLFIQPATITSLVWHQAAASLSEQSSLTALCRSRNETLLSTYAGSERSSRELSAAGETLEAIVANATPGSSRVAVQSGCRPSHKQSLYAAVPHCNSSRTMFAYRGIWKGDE